jgi:tetratricopeptide (TPR) repeat protein
VEPIGTITRYFPFIDVETKRIIETIMRESYNFRNFVDILCDKVCQLRAPDQTIFLAVHFAALLFDFERLDKISKIHGKLSIIRPNLFYGSAFQGRPDDFKKVRESADEVLSTHPPDWLALEMLMVKLEAENSEYPTQVYDTSTYDAVVSLIEENQDFDFYRSRLKDTMTIRAIRDGDVIEALELNQEAIDNSEKNDDINRLAHLLRTRAGIIQSTDRLESQELLLRAKDIMDSMGDQGGLADVLFLLSKLESIRGDYDSAIEHNLDCVRIWERIGMPFGMPALTLSTLYNVIGDYDSGLEWARMAEAELASRPVYQPRAILNQAWSMTLQGKLPEANQLLDSVRESMLKSGLESNLGWLYFISSVIEAAEQDFSSAAMSVEESLDIYERSGGFVSFYICLHHRARVEFYSALNEPTSDYKSTGPWLTLLEEKAHSENLPGILGQALLLKATSLIMRSAQSEASKVIEQLASLVNQRNLEFLRPAVNRFIKKNDDSGY